MKMSVTMDLYGQKHLKPASIGDDLFYLGAAVVAAPGCDDLLHAVHDPAVAHQSWMVHQPELLLAWSHAHAG